MKTGNGKKKKNTKILLSGCYEFMMAQVQAMCNHVCVNTPINQFSYSHFVM